MSPASAGNLEVEKYIGACLISSQNRTKSPNHNSNNSNSGNNSRSDLLYHYGRDIYTGNYTNFDGRFRVQRWAGGMPLISFKHHQRCGKRLEQHDQRNHQQSNPLSRLAVHTQGAPLIVTRTFNNSNNRRKNVPFNNNNNNNSNNKLSDNCNNTNISGNINNNNNNKVKNCSESGVAVDAISVTSDESSGSTNSDNCLPRIIKPRKRRKKDRKPPLPHLNQPLQDGFSTDSTSPEIDNNLTNLSPINQFIPFTFNSNNNIQVRSTIQQSFNVVPDKLPLINNYNYNNYKNNDLLYDVTTETPQLHHKFEDVEDINDNINNDIVDINGNQSTLICQCRYCDPSGQIWDIDRNYYSPFLTTPLTNLKTSQQQDNYPIVKSINVEDNSYLLLHRLSSISLNNTDDNNNDRGDDVKVKTRRSGDLEVSTEIVTSLNGHRDLEIKFFSTTTENNCNNSVKRDENIDKFCDNNEIKQIETITN